MSNLGDIITVDVDPDRNGGLDQAAAIVTGRYDDGSLRVRVLGADTGAGDSVRNYVGDDGQPFDAEKYAAAQRQPEPAATEPDATASDTNADGTQPAQQSDPAPDAAPSSPAAPSPFSNA